MNRLLPGTSIPIAFIETIEEAIHELHQRCWSFGHSASDGVHQISGYKAEAHFVVKALTELNASASTNRLGKHHQYRIVVDYYRPEWARKFFAKWKGALRWQRLPEFEKFATMIEKHWDGIIPYGDPNNKMSLGLVEGLNNLISSLTTG